MEMKIPLVTISAFVVVIVLGAVLMPVLNDATETEETYENKGYYRMSHYDSTTDHTFAWDYQNPNVVTVDGNEVSVNGAVNKDVTVIADTNWVVRLSTDSNGDVIRMSIIMATGGTTSASVAGSTSASMTFTSGSMAATFGSNEKSGSYTDLWLPSKDGAYIMKDSDVDAYINGDSELVAYGLTRVKNNAGNTTSSPGFGIAMIGSYDDGVTSTIWRDANDNTISAESVNVTPVSGFEDLYKVSSITATFTLAETVNDETIYTDTPITYNYFIVPYEVTAEKTVHLSANESAILAAIPALVIVALLIGVLAIYARSKME